MAGSARIVGRLALAASVSIVVLLAAEAGVRSFAPWWSDPWKMWRLDPVTARSLRPGVRDAVVHAHSGEFAFRFSTNQSGLRMDRELATNPDPDTARVLFVGDSFTFGYGVDQGLAFPEGFEAASRAGGVPVESINAGFASGFTLDTEYVFTRAVASEWRPQRVVVGVCLSNDLHDLETTRWDVNEGELVAVSKRNDHVPLVLKQSALVNLAVKGAWPALRGLAHQDASPPEPLESPCSSSHPARSQPASPTAEVGGSAVAAKGPLFRSGERLPAEQKVDRILRAWSRHADELDYELELLLIPDAEEVQWPSNARRLARREAARSVFADSARRSGVRTLDPASALRAHYCATGEKLYFDVDGHWNEAGHRFVAGWLASQLQSSPERD